MAKKDAPQVFWDRVDIKTPQECWPWKTGLSSTGYGQMYYHGKMQHSHRLAYTITHGSIPDGLYILHSCNNRFCCNPDHLRPGTAQDNAEDKVKAGHITSGETNYHAKLTDAQVLEIRSIYASSKSSYGALAKMFNVSRSAIHWIIKRQTWKHI